MDFARLLEACEVLGCNADHWTSMTNGWPPYFHINPAPPITYWWIWMPLQGVKIFIGTHTLSGSTMINTPWYAKIHAQELFYFMILPVGRTVIDPAASLKTRLELYTDAHGTLIFDNYDDCSPKNHERTHRVEVGVIGYNLKLQMYQINSLYLTSWCRHHNSVLGSKSCTRRTQCHKDPLWRYGFVSGYSCTLQN